VAYRVDPCCCPRCEGTAAGRTLLELARQQLRGAVRILATGRAGLRARVREAYLRHLSGLRPEEDLPRECRDALVALRARVFPGDRLSEEDAAEVADAIVGLYDRTARALGRAAD
jgi:hypothetical protein